MQKTPSVDEIMRDMLRSAKLIAVVGLSADTWRPSYSIARYLQAQGYRIIPVNPHVDEVLGETAYPNLAAVPYPIDLLNVFRRASALGGHVDEAIARGVGGIWTQLGVRDVAAAERARQAGIPMVMDRCIAVEHRRLIGRDG